MFTLHTVFLELCESFQSELYMRAVAFIVLFFYISAIQWLVIKLYHYFQFTAFLSSIT